MNMDLIDLTIIGPAIIAGLLVLSTHVPLGLVVLKRGIIFIDLAIAQIAGLGVIISYSIFDSPPHWLVQVFAVISAILGAYLLRWTETRWVNIQEALIGIVFVFSASLSIILLAGNPHGGEQLKELLSGQVLWVTSEQLIETALIYVLLFVVWRFFKPSRSNTGFYIIFAIAITVSVQLVGIYLVFSSLIIPAVAAYKIASTRSKLLVAYLSGLTGYLVGLIVSSITDLPSGPMIVVCLVLSAIITWATVRSNSPAER